MRKKIMKKLLTILSVLVFVLVISKFTEGALIKKDLYNPGDELLIQDTETGLEWMNMSLTDGLTASQIRSDYGGYLSAGFRLATATEVTAVMESGGLIPDGVIRFGGVGYQSAVNFLDLFGITDPNPPTNFFGNNSWIEGSSSLYPDFVAHAYVAIRTTTEMYRAGLVYDGSFDGHWSPDTQTDSYGNWVVRNPIPIPSAVWLLGSGLISLVGLRRRFRKR
jgi:hypothetical protein